MLYGITASQISGGITAAYVASAVQFNSARLVLASITCTDNYAFSFAGWLYANWNSPYKSVFAIDPDGDNYSSGYLEGITGGLEFACAPSNATGAGIDIAKPPLVANAWQHFIGSIDTNHAMGAKVSKLYVNDVIPGAGLTPFDVSDAFTITCNGKNLWIGTDTVGSNFFPGAMADFSIWPGISFLTAGDISESTRRLFIDVYGNPVDPAVAIAGLGAPAVILTGNAAAFASNSLGTSGSLTVAEGSLSDAASHP